jgi:hypothetical protein
MSSSTPLSNTMYDILMAIGKDSEFLYDTIDAYIEDAKKQNNQHLVDTWNKIKADRLDHVNLLKGELEKEIHKS